MQHWVKEIAASLLCTLLLLPSAYIGMLLSVALYYIYNNIMLLNIPDWINAVGPASIGGFIAGYAAAHISYKLFKCPARKELGDFRAL
jgi:hypothetical protein